MHTDKQWFALSLSFSEFLQTKKCNSFIKSYSSCLIQFWTLHRTDCTSTSKEMFTYFTEALTKGIEQDIHNICLNYFTMLWCLWFDFMFFRLIKFIHSGLRELLVELSDNTLQFCDVLFTVLCLGSQSVFIIMDQLLTLLGSMCKWCLKLVSLLCQLLDFTCQLNNFCFQRSQCCQVKLQMKQKIGHIKFSMHFCQLFGIFPTLIVLSSPLCLH